ncbi:MAG: hypothetical protein KGI97_07480 [Alphaproteobacteria bacterium]|nr:hypothetical protein [Alphaproteobacteria bacterium]
MNKQTKKHAFLLPFPRLFTRGETDAYDAIPFREAEFFGDEAAPALTAPALWSDEAVSVLAEAARTDVPADLYAVEENTVPSWLWQHRGRAARCVAESDTRQIFDRAVGGAVAQAWKQGLLDSEKHARAFYDEARYALAARHIAIEPEILHGWGLSWAYGAAEEPQADTPTEKPQQSEIANAAIDAIIGAKDGNKKATSGAPWKKLFAAQGKNETRVDLRLSDIAADWHSPAPNPARAAIDLMALRHNDGGINIDALRHTARLLTILLDLNDAQGITITLANLAPLLMALGLAYDSEAGRALTASIAALVTAECMAASAEMANFRGASEAFAANRDAIMRNLRNHARAAHGDAADYERLSVLPAPLPLKNCPDLALVAEAQSRWNDALTMARTFGLRATQATDMTPSPRLAMLMQSASQGLEPMRNLTVLAADEADGYRTELHPAVIEALTRLSYPRNAAMAVTQHIAGTKSLRKAPAINAASLHARGIDAAAFAKIEAYLPHVDTIRLAVTPWIVGIDFCRTQLKIPARKLESPRFDLLSHFGFSDEDIAKANAYCYGHSTARSAKTLHLRHRSVFACGNEVGTDARLRMAAAVQSFVSGDIGTVLTLPAAQSVENGRETMLTAWRSGIKSLTLVFDPALAAPRTPKRAARRIAAASQPHAKPIGPAKRIAKNGKTAPATTVRKPNEKRLRSH